MTDIQYQTGGWLPAGCSRRVVRSERRHDIDTIKGYTIASRIQDTASWVCVMFVALCYRQCTPVDVDHQATICTQCALALYSECVCVDGYIAGQSHTCYIDISLRALLSLLHHTAWTVYCAQALHTLLLASNKLTNPL